jgi:hypothetical protein
MRIQKSGALAPWWSILDQGLYAASKISGTGGTPYPLNKSTNFVGKAEKSISIYFTEEMKKTYNNYKTRVDTLISRVEILKANLLNLKDSTTSDRGILDSFKNITEIPEKWYNKIKRSILKNSNGIDTITTEVVKITTLSEKLPPVTTQQSIIRGRFGSIKQIAASILQKLRK